MSASLAIFVLIGTAILFRPTVALADERKAGVEKTYRQLSTEQAMEMVVSVGDQMCECKILPKHIHGKTFAFLLKPDGARVTKVQVTVSEASDGGTTVLVNVGRANAFFKDPKDAPGIARRFFDELDAQVTSYRFARATDSVASGQLTNLRQSLVGRNVVARIILPVLLKPEGELEFLPTNRTVKPNEVATVTDVMFCSDYPVRAQTDCGRNYEFGRRVVIVLLNNGQLRLAPTSADKSKSDKWLDFSDTLNTLICQLGNALDCVQANQRRQLNQIEREQRRAEFAYAQAERQRSERTNLEVAGPEVVFVIPTNKEATAPGENREGAQKPDLQTQILEQLSRVANFLQ